MKSILKTIAAVAMLAFSAPAFAGGLEVKTDDGKFRVGGRIMLDLAVHNEDKSQMNNGTEFRRARLFMKGTVFKDWGFKAQYDFAEDTLATKDLYIKYKPLGITIGQFKQPLSLEELTSSKYITFIERSSPNSFAIGRRIGVGYHTGADNYSFAASVYGRSVGTTTASKTRDEGFGAAGRLTFAPWASDTSALHLGIAASRERPQDGSNTARFRARPEAHTDGARLIDTGTLANVDSITRYGVEAALVKGPFSVQAEYLASNLSRNFGNPDASFDGGYVFASWFLTGESRPYSAKKGTFGRVKPNTEYGAWELATRYSNLNLNDGLVKGGEMDNWTVAVNYYMNPHARLMLNYIVVDTDVNAVTPDDDPSIFLARAQIDW